VRVHVPPDLPPVQVDAVQVERALANLLENAFKHSPPDEDVVVRATATRRDVIVRVVDRGPGIPAGEQERIFEPFYGDREASQAAGSGLGLAITKGFAEANGGRAWVESHPGQGASFALAFEAVAVRAPVEA
jgi:two-component system sensor histidine kinase KdpD